MTENYSVLSPEVREIGGKSVGTFNAAFFEMLMEFDRVYVFGQAKSHCVLSTLRDMQEHIAKTDPSLMDKIYVLEDATSPVPAPPVRRRRWTFRASPTPRSRSSRPPGCTS